MSDAPKIIRAYNSRNSGYGFVAFGPQPHFADVEYIRADVSAARIADLERQLAEARTDAEQAVALAYQRAGNAAGTYCWHRYASKAEGGQLSSPAVFTSHTHQDIERAILALAPADALAEVQALKAERDELDKSRQAWIDVAYGARNRAEAAEAEVEKLRAMLQIAEANTSLNAAISAANLARAEAAEAEVEKLRAERDELLRAARAVDDPQG